MPLRIRLAWTSGLDLGFSIERLADGLLYDFADGVFKDAPVALIAALPEDVGPFWGRYKVTLSPTPWAQFRDGDYSVTVHDRGQVAGGGRGAAVIQLAVVMWAGDDRTLSPLELGRVALADLARRLSRVSG